MTSDPQILVDTSVGSKELKPLINAMGVHCDTSPLQFGDAYFEGNGPDGTIAIGVERKTLHDLLACIEDGRLSGHQLIGMKNMYSVCFLLLEGYWKSREDGMLMESRDGCQWWVCRPSGKPVMYSRIRRFLISLAHSGVIVNYTRNPLHTAQDICEIYHYHQKKWENHTSLKKMHKLAIPSLSGKPTVTRKWAVALDDVGEKLSEEAQKVFRKPITLATADECAWLRVPGISVNMARKIVRQINDF